MRNVARIDEKARDSASAAIAKAELDFMRRWPTFTDEFKTAYQGSGVIRVLSRVKTGKWVPLARYAVSIRGHRIEVRMIWCDAGFFRGGNKLVDKALLIA